ncbi:MAG: hypothetical protein ABFQ95_06955 [Pseudomonadota bacterium]
MIKKCISGFALVCILGLGGSIFYIKYQVLALESSLLQMQRQIYHAKESVHLLHAEWAYLNEPKRLQKLALHHLNLKPARPMQLVAVQALRPVSKPDLLESCETMLCQNQMAVTLVQ